MLDDPDEPDDPFVATPEYDAWCAEYANAHPDRPDPRFTPEEAKAFTFVWPATAIRRARNGRFARKGA